ncbi:hypothetical protein JOF56_011010 [Kibdelosporangium banguiense]|uniref:Uncharacterized protein n=1 Tax=Kibdelosporangium banguiense TaxID=1365924 RepID=A0ABS4U1Y0_9PSEU|nr:hypothetical protein [Kibdelosporangium banguiense]MBP2330625.1 hypothetical protein [Kibdelosporangium banguiense]
MTTPALTPADRAWQPATAIRDHMRLTFPGETTPAAGLVIIPAVNAADCRYTGGWSILHTESGWHLGIASVPLPYAREAAELLSQLDADWTETATQLRRPGRGLASAVWEIRARVHQAWEDGQPTWFARHSWQHTRPAWIVRSAEWTAPDYRLDSWPELVAWLDTHHNDPRYRVGAICRHPFATWRLVCAAPLCHHHADTTGQPAVLSFENDDGESFEIREPDRGEAARYARSVNWTRHSLQHWTCPTCSTEHTANPNPDLCHC